MTWDDRKLIRQMYVYDYKSLSAIAKHLKTHKEAVRRALHLMGIELRAYTSTRTCKIPGCGKECFKRLCRNGKGYSLSGVYCLEHTRERWQRNNQNWMKNYYARKQKMVYSKTQEHQQGEPTPINGHAGVSSSSTATV